jgi:hypothetical protein
MIRVESFLEKKKHFLRRARLIQAGGHLHVSKYRNNPLFLGYNQMKCGTVGVTVLTIYVVLSEATSRATP